MLEFGNKIIYISNIGGEAHLINKSSFTEMRIPKNALSACGTDGHLWNDFFYVVPSKVGVVVYEGWVDESDERSGFHWKKFKEVVN